MLLAPAAQQRRKLGPASHHKSADPRRAADLVGGQSDEVGADRAGLEGELAGGLDGVTMEQGAIPPHNRGDLGHWLDDAGLVIGIHHRYQGRA